VDTGAAVAAAGEADGVGASFNAKDAVARSDPTATPTTMAVVARGTIIYSLSRVPDVREEVLSSAP
jgi:hypothetical protein